MSGGMQTTHARASVPHIGPWVPTAVVHLAYLAVAVALCVLVLESPLWLAIGVLLAVAGTLVPHVVPTWWLLLGLGLSQFWREPSATDIVYYLLIAGVHLLHVLGSLTRLLPWDGRMQVVALGRSLRRFGLVQAVVQPVAAGALFAFGGSPGAIPGLSILAAVMLGVVTIVFARRLRRAQAHD